MTLVHVTRLGRRRLLLAALLALLTWSALAAIAPAAHAASAWWRLEASPAPTILQPGHEAQIVLTATDVGDEATNGAITITDTLPKHLKVIPWAGASACKDSKVFGHPEVTEQPCIKTPYASAAPEEGPCETSGTPQAGETVTCKFAEQLPPFEVLEVLIPVEVEEEATSGQNTMSIEGGAPAASLTSTFTVESAETPFGIHEYELVAENEGGTTDTQAGTHPFQLTTVLNLNQRLEVNPLTGLRGGSAPQLLKDLRLKLPPGLVGDTNEEAIPQCSDAAFSTIEPNGSTNLCPAKTAVGVALVSANDSAGGLGAVRRVVPVFSLKPAPGEPARFGFEVLKVTVVLDTAVLTGGDYSVITTVKNASQGVQVLGSQVTLWGEPGNESHDNSRGWHCLVDGGNNSAEMNPNHKGCNPENPEEGHEPEARLTKAFLSLPTSCGSEWKSTVLADSWLEPGPREADGEPGELNKEGKAEPGAKWKEESWSSGHLEGCDKVPFAPSISVEPETQAANTPTGLLVNVHLPQATTLELGGIAESAIKESSVSLPEGVLLNPSAANGLETCSMGLAGSEPIGERPEKSGVPAPLFTRYLPEKIEPGANFCPDGSKVGIVDINTPDLPHHIEGGVYLAQQTANPFGSLFAMYIIAEDPISKVVVKLAGEISLNTTTGRVTTTFKNTPQLPFEDLKLQLFGGSRASITTPPTCGSYTTDASFVPWSAPGSPTPASSTFDITSGAEASGCAGTLPLTPGFKAGTTNNAAAGFTGFDLTLSHPDNNQAPTSLSMTLPPGLAALLSSVTLCPEPQASQGTCGEDSLIGHATATAGLGSTPFTETGGRVYITGPYGGAPFGLSVVIPTKTPAFDFGEVVTRSALFVDRNTAAVTINSVLPTMINTTTTSTGVPVQLKQIHVTVDRPGFQFNPTNCMPKAIEGTVTGSQGGSAHVSSNYQVVNCASLPFGPKLSATTGGQASKANGASLNVKVTSGGLGQANIQKVFLTLPKALPSRLTTIQKACADSIFNANPATCNEGSVIGRATIHTPVLRSPLSGPAYLVSHGNAAFPDVEFVLQGEGVTLILDGKTDIKKGITYSRFESAPDAPFTTFETQLPVGPHSALTANVPESQHYSLCKTKLVMPTEITAQNGALIKQETKIGLTGCVASNKAKALSRAQKLKRALKQCNKKFKHNNKKLAACKKQAYKKYGPKKKASKHSSKGKK